MMVEIVSEKCGITAHDLFNQPTFTTVFKNFIQWIKICVTEAQQTCVPYYPGIHGCKHCNYFTFYIVLVAHNGFPFDFIFLVAEVKHRKLDEIFDSIDIYFADTLYDEAFCITCFVVTHLYKYLNI